MLIVPEYWTENRDGTLEADVELEVGESKDLGITLRWINDEENLGSKSNKAELVGGDNIVNYDDTNEEDNVSEATILISIKTGWQVSVIIIITTLLSITIAGCLIVIILRTSGKGPNIHNIRFLNK